MKAKQQTIFADGARMRSHNKRAGFVQKGGKTILYFRFADEEPDKPACSHKCLKGKVRETLVALSNEAMEDIVKCWIEFKKQQLIQSIG